MQAWQQVQEAVAALEKTSVGSPTVGVILGSGLGAFADTLKNAERVRYQDIVHFPQSHVVGHAGEFVVGELEGRRCAVMSGRVHYYEGHAMERVCFGVRVLAGLGVKTLVVTNAAGGVNSHYEPGDLMVIQDHLNLTGDNPLRGPNDARFGPRFFDMTEAYSGALRKKWHEAARALGVSLREGVYASVAGPNYETPAEVRMLQRLGADAVGMSTVAEVLAARHLGLQVAGLSVVTNKAAGLSGNALSHQEVTDIADRVRGKLCELLSQMVARL